MPNLAQVFARPRKASRQSRPSSLRVPPLTLRLVTWHRMSRSEPLVCSGMSGSSPQQIEKVPSALAVGGAEPGEIVVANLCADAVSTFVARTSVIHRDPVGGLQAGAQHVTRFGKELVLPGNQQAHHLPLRDVDTDRL